MLSIREHDARRDLVLSFHGIANDDKRIDSSLAVRNDVVRLVEIPLVNLLNGNEIIDLGGMSAVESQSVELFVLVCDVLSLREFVASALMFRVNDPTGLFVDHLLSQPVTRLGVDLVEVSSFRLGRSRKERDRTSHERELERALPIGTRRHLILRDSRNFNRTENFLFRRDPSEVPNGQKATGEIPR